VTRRAALASLGPAGLAALALLAVLLAAGCSATRPPYRATVQSCFSFGVQAIRRHITVVTLPPACAGLSQQQVNTAVVRAIRAAVGPQPKASARQAAYRESRYLFHLAKTIRPPRAIVPAAGPAPKSSGWPLILGALAAWVTTAAAGSYLLAGLLRAFGSSLRSIWRDGRPGLTKIPPVIVGHFGLAIAGLGIWIGFAATGFTVLAWICVGLILPVAGLGMAALVGGGPETGAAGGKPDASKGPPVVAIALHGIFATATILLVLLAAIAA